MRFVGLALHDPVPDAKAIWLFREQLARTGAAEKLFARFDALLRARGWLAMGGQIPGSSPGTSATVIKGGGVPVIAEADRGGDMTRRTPSFVRALLGRWRITEMGERDGLTDPQPRISREDSSQQAFSRSKPTVTTVRFARRPRLRRVLPGGLRRMHPCQRPLLGSLGTASRLVGHIFIHKGDDQASSPNASDFFNSL